MDESFMSTGSFDEESFITEALECENESSKLSTNANERNGGSNLIDISSLLTKPIDFPKSKLTFNDAETPRNSDSHMRRHKKRKSFARRCLSTDLNCGYSLNSEEEPMSFQEFRAPKESTKRTYEGLFSLKCSNILSSIENTTSPAKSKSEKKSSATAIDLTPEFDVAKKCKSSVFNAFPRVPLKANNNTCATNASTSGGSGAVPLQKCYSENHATIFRALQVSSSDRTLIGDFSKQYALPLLAQSKHQDLKSISCHVLADLVRGNYRDTIESYTIVDCRYPYEFDGGHIANAINLYTQEHVLAQFVSNRAKEAEATALNAKRNILIFHCEFSSERGPSLCRFLRNKDRVKNSVVYPNLYYPELYLLEGGYKEFFTHYSSLCQPCAYMPMHAKDHEDDLRKFRSLVKSHSFDSKFTTHKRNLRL